MSVSIDIHEYNYNHLYRIIAELVEGKVPEGRSVKEFFERVLPQFGKRYGDYFIVLWNEVYEEYNAGVELMHAVDLYFGLEDTYLDGYAWGTSHANAFEVLEDLGLDPLILDG